MRRVSTTKKPLVPVVPEVGKVPEEEQ